MKRKWVLNYRERIPPVSVDALCSSYCDNYVFTPAGQATESSKTADSVAVSGNVSVSRDQPNQDLVFEEMDANGHQEQAVLQKLM